MHDIGNAVVQHRLFMQLYAYPALYLIRYCQMNRQKCQLSRILDFTGVAVSDCPEKAIHLILEKQYIKSILD